MSFYGVQFLPGDIKEVSGVINHPRFVRLPSKPAVLRTKKSVPAVKSATPPVNKAEPTPPAAVDGSGKSTEKDGEQ
ncbi:hypothetical protein [uncultured Duncaniella sp.]|uniref:hypothetical protein n=1 Tax=uncultured Duncaniella sp. TaxID=2768039 RepID=UPI00261697B0|nr:hypothetical protein [uncultured Duncaniella sp.]